MQTENTKNVLYVLKKTQSHPVEAQLSATWRNGVMAEVYASSVQKKIPLLERVAPRVAVFAVIMLVVLSLPCVRTVNNLMSLVDSELVQMVTDSNQFWEIL